VLPGLTDDSRAICDSVAERLEADAASLASSMTDAVLREVPVYAGQATPELRRTVHTHSLDHVHAVVRTIRAWRLPSGEELAFVRARAALRATQQLPLSAVLHSYRIGHRTVWERLVCLVGDRSDAFDAMLALTTLTLSYTDTISAALADGYVESQRRQVADSDRDRRELLEHLLHSRLPHDVEMTRLASVFDLTPGGEVLVVVLGQPTAANGSSEVLGRAAETVRRHLSVLVAQPFVVAREQEIVAIVALARGRTTSVGKVVRQAHAELVERDAPWAGGVSTVCAGLAEVARGYEEARRALESVGGGCVAVLLEMPVNEYLLQRADATAVRLVPPAARRLFESNLAADTILVETLQAYARADMSVRIAAQRLCVHPNTVTYRLEKLERVLGRDPRRFSDLVEITAWAGLIAGRDAEFGDPHNRFSHAEQRRPD
jgi:hypothetical protein